MTARSQADIDQDVSKKYMLIKEFAVLSGNTETEPFAQKPPTSKIKKVIESQKTLF